MNPNIFNMLDMKMYGLHSVIYNIKKAQLEHNLFVREIQNGSKTSKLYLCNLLQYFVLMTYHQVCNQSNTTGATSEAGTAFLPFRSTRVHPRVLVGFVLLELLVFCVVFCRSQSFFFWPLYMCCLSFCDLWIPITYLRVFKVFLRALLYETMFHYTIM